jgi:hypothetical protein
MEWFFRRLQRILTLTCVGLSVVAVVVGCHHACKSGKCENLHVDNCSDIPQGAIPKPIGTYSNELLNRQAAKGERDDFVFYYNEWVDDQAVLGPFGGWHLDHVIQRLRHVPFAVIVQPEPDKPTLNALRQKALIEALVEAGYTDAPQRVFIGRPPAEGLYGDEAERIYPQLARGGLLGIGGVGFLGFGGFAGFGGGFGNFGGFGGFPGVGLGGFGGFVGFR